MLLGSICIINGNQDKIEKKVKEILNQLNKKLLKKDHPDILYVEKEKDKQSIGIDQVRKIINFLSLKPFSTNYKVVVLYRADLLNPTAQNALLKTLEEPPKFALIILCTKTEEDLLPTVMSRCRKIFVSNHELEAIPNNEKVKIKDKYSLEIFKNKDLGSKLSSIEDLSKKDKQDILVILDNWILQQRNSLIKVDTIQKNSTYQKQADTMLMERMLEVKKDLENTNVNTRLALEYLWIGETS